MFGGVALKRWLGDDRNARLFNRSMGALLAFSTIAIHL
jgi:hypothetical protein